MQGFFYLPSNFPFTFRHARQLYTVSTIFIVSPNQTSLLLHSQAAVTSTQLPFASAVLSLLPFTRLCNSLQTLLIICLSGLSLILCTD